MTRTNVVLDDKIVDECKKATGIKTRKDLIDYALREVLRHENQKKLLDLKGNVNWHGDLSMWRKGSFA